MLCTRGDVVSVTIMDFLLRTAPVKKMGSVNVVFGGNRKSN
jgi:hypothetical protein